MSRACKKCGKTVYHAEEQLYDGMIFHMGCFTIWNREKTQEDLGRRNRGYESKADVQPAYYRTGDPSGQAPRMESGAEYKGDNSPRGVVEGAEKVCGKCKHGNRATAKFCGECGSPL